MKTMTKSKAAVPVKKQKAPAKKVTLQMDAPPISVPVKTLPRCRCGKAVTFQSVAQNESFCSDACYELARAMKRGTEQAKVKIAKSGTEALFQQGDIMFPVDAKDINKVVDGNRAGTPIDRLLDSQLLALAQMNGLSIAPFNRVFLRPILIGFLQLVWLRDVENHESEHLFENHRNRVTWYERELREFASKPIVAVAASDGGINRAARRGGAAVPSAGLTSIIKLLKKDMAGLPKQAATILEILKEKKGEASLADLQNAMVGRVVSKQPMATIWGFYKSRLVKEGFVAVQA